MIGPVIDSSLTLIGGILGAAGGHRLSAGLRANLPLTFGVISIAMGVSMIVKLHSLPPVIIATVLGAICGELAALEKCVNRLAIRLRGMMEKLLPTRPSSALSQEEFLTQFVAVLVLFCASGTGIFGAMNEGITGDPSLLMAKAVLDLFTAAIFAATLGFPVAAVAIPQFLLQATLHGLGSMILPHTTPALIGDFSGCGGIIMLATGFRIADIKSFPITNLLPALALIMPISAAWSKWVG